MKSSERQTGRDVFEILARENADMLVGYLRSLVEPHAVDDLFQDTLLTAWRRLSEFDRSRSFGPWLRGIARNLVLKHRTRGRDVVSVDAGVLDALEDRFAQVARRAETFRASVDRLWDCVRRLPEKLRTAIRLTYSDGLGTRQVGERVGASEEAVKKRLQRGRRLLADCVAGGEPTA